MTNEKGGEVVTFCNSQQEVDHKLAKSCNHNNFAKEKDDFEYFVVLGWQGAIGTSTFNSMLGMIKTNN